MLLKLLILFIILTLIKCDLQIPRVNPSETRYYKFNMLTDVTPIRYNIDISLDPKRNFQYYNGTSKIEFRSNVETNFIALHFKLSHLIDIHDISLVNLNTAIKLVNYNVTYFEDGDDPLIGIESSVPQFLKRDTVYSLNIVYTVRFNEGERKGFFKFCYKSNGLEDNCFTTTHFELNNIRLAFPSFDNATLKAHFRIRVKHRSDMMAKSNMPGRIIADGDGTETTIFDESPPMSTYLVAIAIGNFESTPIDSFSNLTMNFYTPAGIGKCTLLEKYAGQFVYSLENYLDRPFPLPKLDYFASYTATDTIQGMEQWGLISFDGEAILDTDNLEDFVRTENVIRVIAHEIVHQYFGNLVSVKELNSKWLKEGITTYFTSRVSAQVFPHENYMERMFVIDLLFAMQFEGNFEAGVILNNYAILHQNLLSSLSAIHGIYTKGSTFTNMICHVLGEDTFQKFIQNLINNFEYDSISIDDFINELQFVNDMDGKIPEDIDIAGFVNSWINQPKFPIVTVTRNYDTGVVEIRQDSTQHDTFWIPFNFATKTNPNFEVTTPDGWLKNVPAMNITITNLKPDDWIMFNKQSTGYYIVNYDARNWNLIVDLLSTDAGFSVIAPLNRAKLILDVTLLYGKGLLSDNILFKIINLLKREHNYLAWSVVQDFMIWKPDLKLYLEENIDELIQHFYTHYGSVHHSNDTRITKLARTRAIELGCMLNYKKCFQDMETAATRIARQEGDFNDMNIDWAMFKMIYAHGVQDDVQFEAFLRIVNRSKSKEVLDYFYKNLEDKVLITAFQKSFVTTVYDLPSNNADQEDLRLNLDLLPMDIFYDLTILNDCLIANCYDFVAVFPNANARSDQIYRVVEMVLKNMDTPKSIYSDGNTRFSTFHEVLENIERKYGGDVADGIRAKYDINKTQLTVRHDFD